MTQPDLTTEVRSGDWLGIWGKQYPIIKPLGNGWHLVAHPNGPAIARTDNWNYLGHLAHHWTNDQDEVPPSIRSAALQELMDWAVKQPTWPAHNNQASSLPGKLEIERLRGIIARNALDRLSGEHATETHVTAKDIEDSMQILYARQAARQPEP